MDGVAYIVASDGTIRAVGGEWRRFALGNEGGGIADPDSVVGTRLLDHVTGEAVRVSLVALMERGAAHGRVVYSYRCDSPELRRVMRMSITCLEDSILPSLLFHSVQLETHDRVALGHLNPPKPIGAGDELPFLEVSADELPFLGICSYCADVRFPAGAAEGDGRWISAQEYYRRGGTEAVMLSHSVCPRCIEEILEPELEAI